MSNINLFTPFRIIIFVIETIAALAIELYLLNNIKFSTSETENSTNLIQMFIHDASVITIILLVAFLLWQLWYWRKKDNELKRKDLLKTIRQLHLNQCSLSVQAQDGNKNEVQKHVKKINTLLSRVERHESGEIIHEIRYKEGKKEGKQ